MVPFSAFASARWSLGSPKLERFNAFPSMNIQGQPAQGHSTGESMAIMEQLASRLPQGISFDWSGLSYQERMSTKQGPLLYAFSIFVIFLCVAALTKLTIPLLICSCCRWRVWAIVATAA
jgi:HAE1 family hydrophobic/amphiphilic exporter-1